MFNGEANGWYKAYDARTGKELWKYNCGAGVNSPAVSYMVNGKQYIAVAAGGNNQIDSKRGNSVFVFAVAVTFAATSGHSGTGVAVLLSTRGPDAQA